MSFENIKNKYKKNIHLIGIGGIGMSAIALILKRIGYQVQGSDQAYNNNIKSLEDNGIKCFVGHDHKNIDDEVSLVIKTSIVQDNNPEILAAKEKSVSIIRRADMLAHIMAEKKGISIAGTHGKTSTTAMTAVLLDSAGLDPTVLNGGIINYYNSNSKFGDGEFVVAESDESDGSFIDLPTYIGAITNIEADHMDFYNNNFDRLLSYFKQYVEQIPGDGMVALCVDDEEVKKLHDELSDNQDNIVTYGLKVPADVMASNIRSSVNGLTFDVTIKKDHRFIEDIKISAYGNHSVLNALAAISIANFLSLSDEKIKKGFANFTGVKRRFAKVGEYNGAVIIDDYAHHPTEIKVTIKAARDLVEKKKVIVVFQPHKHSRVKDLFDEFCKSFFNADLVIVSDIYSVGQNNVEEVNQDSLISGIIKSGQKNVLKLEDKTDLAEMLIKQEIEQGDIILMLGAGDITRWAADLPQELNSHVD